MELRGIIQYWDFIIQLIRRDLVSRYKRSTLGIAWTMLSPLGTMVIITVIFSQLFHKVDKFPVYLLSGLLAWNFFAQTTNAAIQQTIWGGRLFKQIYLPRTSFVLAAVGTGLVNLILSLAPLSVIMVLIQVPFSWALIVLPISILILSMFTLGVSLFLSSFAMNFSDIKEMYQMALMAWMYLTPIIYPETILTENTRQFIYYLNPMYHFIRLFRLPIYEARLPTLIEYLSATCISLLTLAVGWQLFNKKAQKIAYYA